ERADSVCGIVFDAADEFVRVGIRVKFRAIYIFEDSVDHAHVHQQPLCPRARTGEVPVDRPATILDRDTCPRTELPCVGTDPSLDECQAPDDAGECRKSAGTKDAPQSWDPSGLRQDGFARQHRFSFSESSEIIAARARSRPQQKTNPL